MFSADPVIGDSVSKINAADGVFLILEVLAKSFARGGAVSSNNTLFQTMSFNNYMLCKQLIVTIG